MLFLKVPKFPSHKALKSDSQRSFCAKWLRAASYRETISAIPRYYGAKNDFTHAHHTRTRTPHTHTHTHTFTIWDFGILQKGSPERCRFRFLPFSSVFCPFPFLPFWLFFYFSGFRSFVFFRFLPFYSFFFLFSSFFSVFFCFIFRRKKKGRRRSRDPFCETPRINQQHTKGGKNPHAHKNKIGTSIPPPSKKPATPPLNEASYGHGGFPADSEQKDPENARRPQNWCRHFRPQNYGWRNCGHEALSEKGIKTDGFQNHKFWDCQNSQFWWTNNFGTRLGGSLARKRVSNRWFSKWQVPGTLKTHAWCTSNSGTHLGVSEFPITQDICYTVLSGRNYFV